MSNRPDGLGIIDPAETAIQLLLEKLRSEAQRRNWILSRLPPWFPATRVRYGWVNDSVVAVFEPSRNNSDEYVARGPVPCDTAVLLERQAGFPTIERVFLELRSDLDSLISAEASPGKVPEFQLQANVALTNAGLAGHHGPFAVSDVMLKLVDDRDNVMTVRFIPYAFFARNSDITAPHRFWERNGDYLVGYFQRVHDSVLGDINEGKSALAAPTSLAESRKSNVLILGSYAEAARAGLEALQHRLRARGYNPLLLRELAEEAQWTLPQKARAWGVSSRFCVVLDDQPSGHIAEYEILKASQCIIALVRPETGGSTAMIGDDHLLDVTHVNMFKYKRSPDEVVDAMVKWAENFIETKAKALDSAYTWRQEPRSSS